MVEDVGDGGEEVDAVVGDLRGAAAVGGGAVVGAGEDAVSVTVGRWGVRTFASSETKRFF